MTLQEALISLGDKPLSASPYSSAIRALVLAQLGKKGSTITKDTPGYIVLSQVYKIANEAKRNTVLEHQLGVVRGTDMYKQFVLYSAGALAAVAIIVAMAVVFSDATVKVELIDVLKMTIQEFFSFLKFIFEKWFESTNTTPAA
ncbi:virion structural protein [Pseudomonas phage Noxifer]|uniref:Virion structural protein n=1 Tax=Pseudomonas phage Noxifer TaxID=2006684 RepID=A0A1Y0SUX8_9CAUD|nr:virion structural protein [Pseudomonas phage Noxifer]ARV77311.1 hypothetical protein NOXIFER_142 [Pseudomonas phage Noxifer]